MNLRYFFVVLVLYSSTSMAQTTFLAYARSLPIVLTPQSQAQVVVCPRGCAAGQQVERLSIGELLTSTPSAASIKGHASAAVSTSLDTYVQSLPVTTSASSAHAIGSATGCGTPTNLSRISLTGLQSRQANVAHMHAKTKTSLTRVSGSVAFQDFFCALPLAILAPAPTDQLLIVSTRGLQRISIGDVMRVGAVSVFYAATGNDANNCQQAAPCQTIARTQQAVRDLLATGHSQITVFGGPGVYRTPKTLEFGPADSPPTGGMVEWTSSDYTNPARWSGGKQVTGWTAVPSTSPQQYQASVDVTPPAPPAGTDPDGTVSYSWQTTPTVLHNGDGTWTLTEVNTPPTRKVYLNSEYVGDAYSLMLNNGGHIFRLLNVRSDVEEWDTSQHKWRLGDTQNGPPLDRIFEVYVNDVHATRIASAIIPPSSWSVHYGRSVGPDVPTWTLSGRLSTGMSSWTNVQDIELLLSSPWLVARCPLNSISGTTITLKWNCEMLWRSIRGANDFTAAHQNRAFRIDNVKEWLPSCGAGCWYYDRPTKVLYYIPASAQNMTDGSVDVEVPAVMGLMRIVHAANLTFSHMVFEHATWRQAPYSGGAVSWGANFYNIEPIIQSRAGWALIPPRDDPQQPPGVSDSSSLNMASDYWKSAITVNESSNVSFERNRFTHLAAVALRFGTNTSFGVADSNEFTDNAGGCVQVGQSFVSTTTDVIDTTSQIKVTNNSCLGVGFLYVASVGIDLAGAAADVQIDHNTVQNFNYVAINAAEGWDAYPAANDYGFVRNEIKNNRVINYCNSVVNDCGGIKVEGRSATPFVISGNYVGPSIGTYGCFYTDGGSGAMNRPWNTDWDGNVCARTAGFWAYLLNMKSNTNVQVRNNFYLDGTRLGFNISDGITATNNTAYTTSAAPSAVTEVFNNSGVPAGNPTGP